MSAPICSNCGYELTGLPSLGECPECGQRYAVRARIGIRHSDPAFERGHQLVAKVRTWLLAGAGAVALAVAIGVHVTYDKEAFLWVVGTIGVLLLMTAALSHLSQDRK